MCKWTKGFELFKLTFLKLFFSFWEKNMGLFKTKHCKFLMFPIAIFCKAEKHVYTTGTCISKVILPHSTGNMSDVYQGKS